MHKQFSDITVVVVASSNASCKYKLYICLTCLEWIPKTFTAKADEFTIIHHRHFKSTQSASGRRFELCRMTRLEAQTYLSFLVSWCCSCLTRNCMKWIQPLENERGFHSMQWERLQKRCANPNLQTNSSKPIRMSKLMTAQMMMPMHLKRLPITWIYTSDTTIGILGRSSKVVEINIIDSLIVSDIQDYKDSTKQPPTHPSNPGSTLSPRAPHVQQAALLEVLHRSLQANQSGHYRPCMKQIKVMICMYSIYYIILYYIILYYIYYIILYYIILYYIILYYIILYYIYVYIFTVCIYIYTYTWNLFVRYFGVSTLQKKTLPNQKRGHLGSR